VGEPGSSRPISHFFRIPLPFSLDGESLEGYGQHMFRGDVAAAYLESFGLPPQALNSNAWTLDGSADRVAAAILAWARDNGSQVCCHW
jgi:hypothetical protein